LHDSFKTSGSKSGAKSSAKLTAKQREVLDIIKSNTAVSYRDVAQKMGVIDSAAQKHIDNLKRKGVIKRIGACQGWILENNGRVKEKGKFEDTEILNSIPSPGLSLRLSQIG